jgi:hypothetical protein
VTFAICSTAASGEISDLRSVYLTFLGGSPERKSAWSAPGITTTGYLEEGSSIEELVI